MHEIVGEEDEFPSYVDARHRLLALCYKLRHANMGTEALSQAEVYKCIEQTVSPTVLGRITNMMLGYYVSFDHYTTQYLDVLNTRFLELDKEKRVKNISIMVKRLVEKGDEYQEHGEVVNEAAQTHDCPPSFIELDVDYPEEIDW